MIVVAKWENALDEDRLHRVLDGDIQNDRLTTRMKAACAGLVTKCQFLNRYPIASPSHANPRTLLAFAICSAMRGSYLLAAPAPARL